MPRGPKGERRPADVIGNAVQVMRVLTGQIKECFPADDGKNKAAQELGRMGGKARAAALGKRKRSEIAKKQHDRGGVIASIYSRVLALACC
jgi:hypothetical protein